MNFRLSLLIVSIWSITINSMQYAQNAANSAAYGSKELMDLTIDEKNFEETTQCILSDFSKKLQWKAPQEKQTIPTEIYRTIQIQFTKQEKEAFVDLEKEKQASISLEQEKEILNKKKLEEYQKILLRNQELKETIKKHEAKITELKAESKLAQKRLQNTHKRARQKAKKQQPQLLQQQPFLTVVPSSKSKNEQPTPQQSVLRKKLIALRTLFRKYNVQKETDLKNVFNEICRQTQDNFFEDKINDSSSFEYCANTNELEIFTDDYSI